MLVDNLRFEGRVVVVTGGAGGIGRAIVEDVVRLGAHCVIADLDETAGSSLVGELKAKGFGATYMSLDVSDPEAVRVAMQRVTEEQGSLDALVTCAGVACHGGSLDLPDDTWGRVIEVNMSGTFWCAREAARQMLRLERAGSIVTIGSISGDVANQPQFQTAYNASFRREEKLIMIHDHYLKRRYGALESSDGARVEAKNHRSASRYASRVAPDAASE